MNQISRVKRIGQELLELIFPPVCVLCERPGREAICASCRERFEFIERPYCQRCGKPLPPSASSMMICGQCRQQSPSFDAARAVGLHTATLREAVLRFKFSRRRGLAEPLAELLAECILAEGSAAGGLPWAGLTGVVPVVLHPRRRAWRGFDQAMLLAHQVSALIEVPCLDQVLVRQKDTQPQIGLSPVQRRQNLRGAFAVADPDLVAGGSLLLIDDVYTSGSTLNASARVLRRAGAQAVYALTITRAVPSWHPQVGQRLGDEDDLVQA